MNKTIYFFFTILLFSACKSNDVVLKCKLTKQPIVIKYNKVQDKVYGIKIPLRLDIKNKTISSKKFITIDYKYSPYQKGVGEEVYLITNNSILKTNNNKKKTISSLNKKSYVIYSRYRIDRFDEENTFQQQFKPYVQKMLAENKDTLHIGTVTEFKKKHKELFNALTKNDSISIQFLDGKKLGERITVPVKW